MSNSKREYPCDDWWWIDPKLGGSPYEVKNRTTRALIKSIEACEYSMTIYDRDNPMIKLCCADLDRYREELADRKINPREGDIF